MTVQGADTEAHPAWPALTPPPGNPKFPAADGLRALAITSVFLFHAVDARWVWALNVGVPVFFVISGFLLYRPFVAARLGLAPAVNTRDYFVRRGLRILPAYWAAITIVGLVDGWSPQFIAGDMTLLQTLSPKTVFAIIPAAWTLSVEAMFYCVLPLYAYAVRRTTFDLRVLTALGLGAVAVKVLLFEATGYSVFEYASLPGTMLWFIVGMAGATWSVKAEAGTPTRRLRPAMLAFVSVASLVLLTAISPDPRRFDPLHMPATTLHSELGLYLLSAIFAGTVAALALPRARCAWLPRLLRTAPVAALGLVSYGVYLWHQWLLGALGDIGLGVPFAALASVGAGVASYIIVERPALRRKPGISANAKASSSQRVQVP